MGLQLGKQELINNEVIAFSGYSIEECRQKAKCIKELLKYLDVDSLNLLAKKASIPNVNKKVKTYLKLL